MGTRLGVNRSENLLGKKFGTITPMGKVGRDSRGNAKWLCRCDCGKEYVLLALSIKQRGESPKCPHAAKADKPTWQIWYGMIRRCENKLAINYAKYGGRGVSVCERWKKFSAFLGDMGKRPPGLTLDRINPFGNYEPGNCRWATLSQQAKNTRRSKEVS